jgi:hypothetical protein
VAGSAGCFLPFCSVNKSSSLAGATTRPCARTRCGAAAGGAVGRATGAAGRAMTGVATGRAVLAADGRDAGCANTGCARGITGSAADAVDFNAGTPKQVPHRGHVTSVPASIEPGVTRNISHWGQCSLVSDIRQCLSPGAAHGLIPHARRSGLGWERLRLPFGMVNT